LLSRPQRSRSAAAAATVERESVEWAAAAAYQSVTEAPAR